MGDQPILLDDPLEAEMDLLRLLVFLPTLFEYQASHPMLLGHPMNVLLYLPCSPIGLYGKGQEPLHEVRDVLTVFKLLVAV